jgi:hypothetical protein
MEAAQRQDCRDRESQQRCQRCSDDSTQPGCVKPLQNGPGLLDTQGSENQPFDDGHDPTHQDTDTEGGEE